MSRGVVQVAGEDEDNVGLIGRGSRIRYCPLLGSRPFLGPRPLLDRFIARAADGKEHETNLTNGRIGEDTLQIMLRKGNERR